MCPVLVSNAVFFLFISITISILSHDDTYYYYWDLYAIHFELHY